MKLGEYVIGIILFLIVVMSGITLIVNTSTTANVTLTEEFNDFEYQMNKTENIINQTYAMRDRLAAEGGKISPLDAINLLFNKGYSVLALSITGFSFFDNMITYIGRLYSLYIPNWVPPLIVAITVVIIVFAILGAILNRDLI